MLPELSGVFDAPISHVAQVISFFAVTYGLMQLFYGPLGDRWGKYRIVTLACLGSSIGCLLSGLSPSLDSLVLARVATAVCAAAIIPMSLAWVGDNIRYDLRQETLARLGLGTTLGLTAGQFFGGLITDHLGWRWAFAFMAALFCSVSVLLRRHSPAPIIIAPSDEQGQHFLHQLGKAIQVPWVRTVLIVALIEGATIFGVIAITATHLHVVHQVSLSLAGTVTAVYGVGGVSYMATAKWAIRRFGETGLVRWGGVAFGVAFLTIALTPWWPLAVPACLLAGFGFAMFHNTMQAKATQMMPQARATGVTLFAGCLFLGQSIGVLLLAQFIAWWPTTHVIAVTAIAVILLGFFYASAIAKRNASMADHT
jgi:predicted MFS family arabinose efflux permease